MAAPIAIPGYEKIKHENHFNYTEDQLGEKKLALKMMMELYPGVPYTHCEWVYDLCKNTKDSELQDIMRKVDEEPSKYVATPGESYTMEIIDADQSLEKKYIAIDKNDESSTE